MRPASRRPFLLLAGIVVLAGAAVIFRGGLSFGRMFAFAEVAAFGLGLFWRLVLVVVVLFWLRAALGKKPD